MRRHAGALTAVALAFSLAACPAGDGGGHHGPPARTPSSAEKPLYVENCAVARTNGWAPIHEGRPGYRRELDANHNGIACEAGE
jgi:hypothetical protein